MTSGGGVDLSRFAHLGVEDDVEEGGDDMAVANTEPAPQIATEKDEVTPILLQAVEAMSPTERQRALLTLLERYCPECGENHQGCGCEAPGEVSGVPNG